MSLMCGGSHGSWPGRPDAGTIKGFSLRTRWEILRCICLVLILFELFLFFGKSGLERCFSCCFEGNVNVIFCMSAGPPNTVFYSIVSRLLLLRWAVFDQSGFSETVFIVV